MSSSTLKRKTPALADISGDEQSVDYSEENASDGSDSEEESVQGDSADEIEGMKPQKSRQTKKRKLRATHASAFGATLQSLLDTVTPSSAPLSLKPSIARKRNDEKLEMKAKKVLLVEKKEKEDRGRITDVIGGWGGESERALRKVAQRGGRELYFLFFSRVSSSLISLVSCQALQCSPTSPNAGSSRWRGKESCQRQWKAFSCCSGDCGQVKFQEEEE